MPKRTDKNGAGSISVIGGNNVMKLRKYSLFAAVVGAVMLTAVFAPRANATLVVYYNFEDATLGGAPDFSSEAIGLQTPVMTTNYNPADMATVAGLTANAVPNPPNTDPNVLGLGLSRSSKNDPSYFQFHVDTQFLTTMSLSFAVNTAGNGFTTVTFQYSNDSFATDTHTFGTATISSSTQQVIAFPVPAGADGQADITFRLLFSGGQSNGTDLQNTIDNVRLDGTVIPEPASVVGGLLGACGLCWNQRRRLIRFLRLRPA